MNLANFMAHGMNEKNIILHDELREGGGGGTVLMKDYHLNYNAQ